MLYFTLYRSKSEYASEISNSVMYTDANRFELIQQKLASGCFCPFSFYVPYSYIDAVENSSLYSLYKRGYNLDAHFSFNFVVALRFALLFWKMLTSLPLIVLLDYFNVHYLSLKHSAFIRCAYAARASICFKSQHFLAIIFYNRLNSFPKLPSCLLI